MDRTPVRFPPVTRISLRIKQSNVLCATFFAPHSVRAPDDFPVPPVISKHAKRSGGTPAQGAA
ncbi:hypothetical protein ACFVAG_12095, partial [Streptomyces sp. NPDC057644]|uniref:hypothetical protein n=1 Tax=Streptomyces sp. NPDC057644 TaxID=3346191 RepID=UPI00369F2ED5